MHLSKFLPCRETNTTIEMVLHFVPSAACYRICIEMKACMVGEF